jgi:hypothetical protein
VSVGILSEDATGALTGLSAGELRAKVDTRLQRAGIAVHHPAPGALLLDVRVRRSGEAGERSVGVGLSVGRRVYVPLPGDRFGADECRVWWRSVETPAAALTAVVDTQLDQFVADFLLANPK